MSKYRIIKEDGYYTAQVKKFGLYWGDLSLDCGYSGVSCIQWESIESAMALINEHKSKSNKTEVVWEGD